MAHKRIAQICLGAAVVLAAALAQIAGGGQATLATDGIIYVDADATSGTNDGSSWANAYTTLQPALAEAEAGNQIWVAEGVYKPTEGIEYETCQEIHDAFPDAPDGDYLLNNAGRVFQVYCADMDSDPLEYLTLGDSNQNYAQFTAGVGAPGTDVRTYFSRVRLLPDTWQIDITDYTYSFFTGSLQQGPNTVTAMPYGVAADCIGIGSATGVARIDLRDTPFLVSDTFVKCGYEPGGTWIFSHGDQVVDLTGGGYCGWVQPAPGCLAPPYNDAGGPQPILELDYLHLERRAAFQLKNGVALYGGFDGTETALEERNWETNPTFLSGDIGVEGDPTDNSYHVFFHPEGTDLDESAILDGFTVIDGNADGVAQINTAGGGMFNEWGSSPTLANVTFAYNSATFGGGLYNWYSSPPLSNCTFIGNSALDRGGGMASFGYTAQLTGCAFILNSADYGGGMYSSNSSSPVLTHCTFIDNSADGDGGGFYTVGGSPMLTDCTFSGNWAQYGGGGMHSYNGALPELSRCTFQGNSAGQGGGGMYNSTSSSPVLTNCTFSGNSANLTGGGMHNGWESSPTLINCTFEGNSAAEGGGIYNYNSSNPVLTNCILWSDTSPEIFNFVLSEPVVTYSDIQGGYPDAGSTNIDADPLFANPDAVDYHLGWGSPCIDAGTNTPTSPPGLPSHDFEGDPRIADGDGDGIATVDMGVDEVWTHVYLPLVLKSY